MRPRKALVIAVCGVIVSTTCSQTGKRIHTAARNPLAGPTSIVQLGDSLASGEGILYGYTYDPHAQEWTGGNVDVKWPPPYPNCHDDPHAYGKLIATVYGVSFHQFACTGATFASGIAGPEISDGSELRPAEFGNWATQQGLNADYDAAKPDLVLVTLGADDVQFVNIIEECIKNGYEAYIHYANEECTSDNPGSTIQNDFTKFLPTLVKNYGTLVSWIMARAKANSVPVPKVVFTNYPNPFPDSDTDCPDVSWLYDDQISYLSSLVKKMDKLIVSTIQGLKLSNVTVADVSNVYQEADVDHRWCTSNPWAYGLSIYHVYDPTSFYSQAPFHPTPSGQAGVAALVTGPVVKAFKGLPPTRRPLPTTTSSTLG